MTACFRTVLLSSFSLSLVDVNKQGVDDDVYDDYQCWGYEIVEQIVCCTDKYEETDDDRQRHPHAQASLHKDVVYVCLVGVKHSLSLDFSWQGNAYDVYAGDEQQGYGYEQGFFAVDKYASVIIHLVFDGKVCQDVA